MNTNRKATAAVAGALLVAAVGGGIASRTLIGSDAAVRTASSQGLADAQANAKAKVPYLGPFAANNKKGTVCGPAVRLMEGALRNTTPPIRKTPARNCIGAATTRQIKAFQNRHHIPPSGIYGKRTHQALAHAYTAKQIGDLVYIAQQRIATLRRSTILIVTSHAYQLRGEMGYCDFGSLAQCGHRGDWPNWPDVPRKTDCSGYFSWVLFQAGVPNPNGVGVGNTTSLARRGVPVPFNGPLKVGDAVFYGSNNSHMAVYIGHGLVSSHGRPGLDIHPYGYRPIYAIRRYF